MKPKLSNFKEFANKILQVAFDGNDLDGSDIQDIGVECGLLKEVMATEPCGENCVCAEYNDWPMECYRKTY